MADGNAAAWVAARVVIIVIFWKTILHSLMVAKPFDKRWSIWKQKLRQQAI